MKCFYDTSCGIMAILLLAGSVMPSCSEKETDVSDTGTEVRISSEIVSMTGSEGSAAGEEWNNGDAIGVFMVKAGKGIVVNMASNLRFVTSGNGSFEPAQGELAFPISGEKVDFLAYAPYRDLVYDFIYPLSLSNQQANPVSPLMYADRVQDKDASSPDVDFSFHHCLAKLVMNVSAGEGLPNLDGLTVCIKGLGAETEFDLLYGTFDAETQTGDIIPEKTGDNTYTALLLPADSGLSQENTVDFSIPGNTYTWNMFEDIDRIEKAKIYEFDITVNRAGISVSGTIRDWTDTAWEDVSAGNL